VRLPSGVGGSSVRGCLLFIAHASLFSAAAWRVSSTRASLPFFLVRVAFVASSREVLALVVTFLGAIAGLGCRSTDGGCQILGPDDTWTCGPKHSGIEELRCRTKH
jgi:hypothetical protein